MAIAWSRISSKVIAHPPEADEACRRWCGNGRGRSGVLIPHLVTKRKQQVLGYVTQRALHAHRLTVSPLLPPVASRNLLLYHSLPTHMPYREAKVRRRKDDTRVGTAARGNVERLSRVP